MFLKLNVFLVLFMVNSSLAAVEIKSRIDKGAWIRATAIYPLKGQQITLKVNKIHKSTIRWYQIFPDISKIYNNANPPGAKNPYQWAGFDKIDYKRQELKQFTGQWQIQPFEKKQQNAKYSHFYQEDKGSFWFQVEIEKQGKIKKSPGIEKSTHKGLSPKVFRVSIREGKAYLGHLSTYFNVPAIFGSVTYQSKNYIGVDCADVLVAAYAQWKKKPLKKNYNVAMLVNKFPKRVKFKLNNGVPSKKVRWGTDIRPGDLIAVKYFGARQYQHVGALAKDVNNNGILDNKDLVIHAGPVPLHYSDLQEGSFDGQVVILRPSNRLFHN